MVLGNLTHLFRAVDKQKALTSYNWSGLLVSEHASILSELIITEND